MKIYKELLFMGDKSALDEFKTKAPTFERGDWRYAKLNRDSNYISFDYMGNKVEEAEVSIYFGKESWRDGYIKVGNIVPLNKKHLSIEEYNAILDLFYEEVITPNLKQIPKINVLGPESDEFNPLKYISEKALRKLEGFCNNANKSTGSSHPSDEERWFDFICQTVDDKQTFDYDTIFRFLMDQDYWGKKDPGFIGVMGHYAWDEDQAKKLSLEYNNYVRLLQFYIEWKNRKMNEIIQTS